MPTLLRFLSVLALIGAAIFGVVYALANFVAPEPREIVEPVAPSRFLKKPGE